MPSLGKDLISSKLAIRGAICFGFVALFGFISSFLKRPRQLIYMQGPLIAFQMLVLIPVWSLADQLRQLPLREVAEVIASSKKDNEPLAMVGKIKPSLHFYSNKIVLYYIKSYPIFIFLHIFTEFYLMM